MKRIALFVLLCSLVGCTPVTEKPDVQKKELDGGEELQRLLKMSQPTPASLPDKKTSGEKPPLKNLAGIEVRNGTQPDAPYVHRILSGTVKTVTPIDNFLGQYVLTVMIDDVEFSPIEKEPDPDDAYAIMEVSGEKFLKAKKGDTIHALSISLLSENDHVLLVLTGKATPGKHDRFYLRTHSNH